MNKDLTRFPGSVGAIPHRLFWQVIDEKECLLITLLIGYVLAVGFMSFAVCYKYGPLENERSINLLTWTLQLMGLCFMYSSIQIPQIALAIIITALCTKNLEYPIHWLYITYRWLRGNVTLYWYTQCGMQLQQKETEVLTWESLFVNENVLCVTFVSFKSFFLYSL